MEIVECKPPDGTAPDTVHLLFDGEDEKPWTWKDDGWIAVRKCKPVSAWRMGQLGWTYRHQV